MKKKNPSLPRILPIPLKKRVFKDYQITFIVTLLICLTKCQENEYRDKIKRK